MVFVKRCVLVVCAQLLRAVAVATTRLNFRSNSRNVVFYEVFTQGVDFHAELIIGGCGQKIDPPLAVEF